MLDKLEHTLAITAIPAELINLMLADAGYWELPLRNAGTK
jgi:hypothetical protein